MSFPCGRRPNHRFNAQFPVMVRFCFVAFLQTSKDAKFCQNKPFNVQLKIKRKMSPYEIKGCLIRFKFIHISLIYYLKQHITINFFLSVVKIYNGVSLAYAYSFYCTVQNWPGFSSRFSFRKRELFYVNHLHLSWIPGPSPRALTLSRGEEID